MRLWEDGFDHYGTGTSGLTHMLDGSYGQADGDGSNLTPTTTPTPATGEYSLKVFASTGVLAWTGVRKVLPTAIDKIGMTCRLYIPQLPTYSYANGFCHLLSATQLGNSQLSFFVNINGGISIVQGRNQVGNNGSTVGGTLLGTTDPVLTTNAWNHVEIQAYIHASAGWVRIAVNGIHKLELTGLNTQYDSGKIGSVGQNLSYLAADNAGFYMDDYILYDFTGTAAVDTDFCPTVDGGGKATNYIGELQVWPLFPNGDTASAAFLKSTGVVGYSLINEHIPNDANYIYSTAAADLSEFDLDDLPPEITYIRGLSIHARMSKADAGAAMVKVGMKSAAATVDAAERPVTVAPTYWRDMSNIDPNSSARWTRTSLNAGKFRITRTV